MKPPCGLKKGEWPPHHLPVYEWRQDQLRKMREKRELIRGAKTYYATRPVEFINHWVDTYDPRNSGTDLPTSFPLQMFPKQIEFVRFLHECLIYETDGLCEKSRDMGATWLACAVSVWAWLFWPGIAIGWGSYKKELVDEIGDPKSIFEKMRVLIRRLPAEFWPDEFDPARHMVQRRIVNPQTGATIIGEIGDNIGRGGRTRIYFKDESAHYGHPEMIEAALGDNTRVQIDMSSVNGLGNVFHRKREAGIDWTPQKGVVVGKTNVFVMDYRDHPAKDEEWYNARRAKAIEEGLLHIFAQEVERNYSAAIAGVVIPAEWVKSAIDAHIKLGWRDEGRWLAALDVADNEAGGDANALVKRKGPVLKSCETWGERDTGKTTRRAVDGCKGHGPIDLQYDAIGVGAGVKAESNRLGDEGLLPKGVRFIPWFAGAKPLNGDKPIIPHDNKSPLNKDFYDNLKAQGWWELRLRFERTHRAVTEKVKYSPDELISLPSDLPELRGIEKELSQATASKGSKMKLVIDKSPEGTRSPNRADAIVMAFWPANQGAYDDNMDWVN